MHLMPHILDCGTEDTRRTYRLRITAELAFFEGHFPGFPILPGVVQVDWAIELGRSLLAPDAVFHAMHRLKFMRPITGDTELTLQIGADAAGHSLTFKYYDADHVYSSGRLLFGH